MSRPSPAPGSPRLGKTRKSTRAAGSARTMNFGSGPQVSRRRSSIFSTIPTCRPWTIIIIIVHGRHVGMVENIDDRLRLTCGPEPKFIVRALPAALVLFLVFPSRGEPGAGLGLDIVPPHVLGALAVRPDVLAGETARMATDALVQVEHHRHLRSHVHR